MERKKEFGLVTILLCSMVIDAQAQGKPGDSYPKTDVILHTPLPYPPVREADVVYCKRIESIIDTREKQNWPMNWPKNPLYQIIHDIVAVGDSNSYGKLKVYKNDSLVTPLRIKDINAIGKTCETVPIQVGPSPYDTKDSLICTTMDYKDIKRWEVIEDWIFDKQRSQFYPRIVAIAPMFTPNFNGVPMPEQPMYYISWKELRPFLAKEEVFNPENDVRLSYVDLFDQRLYSSYIIKESNVQDLAIRDSPEYKDSPMQAMYESQRIRTELINKEQEFWEP